MPNAETGGDFRPCALVQDLLPLYNEGEVSPDSRELIVDHLAWCERCAGFLAGAQTVRAHLQRQQRDHLASMRPVGKSSALRSSTTATITAAIKNPALLIVLAFPVVALSAIGAGGLWILMSTSDPLGQLVGYGLKLIAFILLVMFGGMRRPWSMGRLAILVGSYGLGVLAMLLLLDSPNWPLPFMLGCTAIVAIGQAVIGPQLPSMEAHSEDRP